MSGVIVDGEQFERCVCGEYAPFDSIITIFFNGSEGTDVICKYCLDDRMLNLEHYIDRHSGCKIHAFPNAYNNLGIPPDKVWKPSVNRSSGYKYRLSVYSLNL